MFAVIKSGGKQYKVAKDSIFRVEKLEGDSGSEIIFDEVLMLGNGDKEAIIGSPLVKGAKVTAEIINQAREDKIIVFKKKRRQHYRRTQGHRQYMTHLKVKDIKVS